MKNLRRAPGKLIAEGHNIVRVGPDELLTYRLEEVELPQPMDLEIHGLKERLNTVMRLTITSAKAVDGNRIWINDVVLPAVWEVGVNFYEAGSGQEVIRVDWFTLLFKVTRINQRLGQLLFVASVNGATKLILNREF